MVAAEGGSDFGGERRQGRSYTVVVVVVVVEVYRGGGGVFPGGGIQTPREVESILPYRRHKMGGGVCTACACVYPPGRPFPVHPRCQKATRVRAAGARARVYTRTCVCACVCVCV